MGTVERDRKIEDDLIVNSEKANDENDATRLVQDTKTYHSGH